MVKTEEPHSKNRLAATVKQRYADITVAGMMRIREEDLAFCEQKKACTSAAAKAGLMPRELGMDADIVVLGGQTAPAGRSHRPDRAPD